MAATWPATLQQYLNRAEFSQSPQDSNIRTTTETGPPKNRRRFTDPVEFMSCQIWVKNTDFGDFRTFYYTTLQDGSLTFNFDDPITGTTEEWRFHEPYRATPLGGIYTAVTMRWLKVS